MSSFGELRSLLQGNATPEQWKRICDVMDGFEDGQLDDSIMPYVDGATRRWPDRTRVAPESWIRRTLGGEELPFWSVVRMIDLSYHYLGAAEVIALLESPRLSDVTILDLDSNRLGARGARAIEDAPGLERLRELRLSFNGLQDEGLAQIARSRDFVELRVLDLEHNDLLSLDALATSAFGAGLETLVLSQNPLPSSSFRALFEVEEPAAWRSLTLDKTRASDASIEALCARDDVALEHIDIEQTAITKDGVEMLAAWSGSDSMERFSMRGVHGDARVLDALSDGMPNLVDLNLMGTGIRADALVRRVVGGAFPSLRRLHARGLFLTLDHWDELKEALGPGATVTI